MTVVVRDRMPLVIPLAVRRRAGLKNGDELQFKVSRGVITIAPKAPTVDDEYTPAQRRIVDARIAAARKGPYHGPFSTSDDAIRFLNSEIRRRKSGRRTA